MDRHDFLRETKTGIRRVKGLARHETIGQTMDVYGRIRNEMMKEAAEKFGALFNNTFCQPQSSRQIHAKSADGLPTGKNATARFTGGCVG